MNILYTNFMPLRNVAILSLCQAFGFSGLPMVVFVGGIVGTMLAPSPYLATLPVSTMIIGIALFTIPAAFLMKRIGRKYGFALASTAASLAAFGAVYAIYSENFYLFCLFLLLFGGNGAFVAQYRFAAAESVGKKDIGKAVSFVVLGGVLAANLGPEIGKLAKDWLGFGAYSGSFLLLGVLYILVSVILLFLKDIEVPEEATEGVERPLKIIITQPAYLVALISGIVAYSAMAFIMTAAPLSMHVVDKFSLNETKLVIQSHVTAMFLPSLIAGFIISRLGVIKVMLSGIVGMLFAIILAVLGHGFANYAASLILLGIGWNFLFVGSTVLLTQTYRSKERFKAQAVNEFSVFGTQAVVTLLAGTIIFRGSWELLNILNVPLLIITLMLIFILRKRIQVAITPP